MITSFIIHYLGWQVLAPLVRFLDYTTKWETSARPTADHSYGFFNGKRYSAGSRDSPKRQCRSIATSENLLVPRCGSPQRHQPFQLFEPVDHHVDPPERLVATAGHHDEVLAIGHDSVLGAERAAKVVFPLEE